MTLARNFAWLLLAAPLYAFAAEDVKLDRMPVDVNPNDPISLQRGAQVYVNYCLGCHSASYMRYTRLQDLGLTEQQIRDNLVFTGVKVGELMKVAIDPTEAKEWFGTMPPDLTVIARARASHAGSGSDWLYTYLRTFYRDDTRPTGWNNIVFPNVGMPHVLWELSGVNKLVKGEFDDHEKATAAAIGAKGLSMVEAQPGGKWAVLTVANETPGTMSRVEYEAFAADLVNYLDYMAEPSRNKRINIGIVVLLYLGVLFAFAYWMKRTYWKDVH